MKCHQDEWSPWWGNCKCCSPVFELHHWHFGECCGDMSGQSSVHWNIWIQLVRIMSRGQHHLTHEPTDRGRWGRWQQTNMRWTQKKHKLHVAAKAQMEWSALRKPPPPKKTDKHAATIPRGLHNISCMVGHGDHFISSLSLWSSVIISRPLTTTIMKLSVTKW